MTSIATYWDLSVILRVGKPRQNVGNDHFAARSIHKLEVVSLQLDQESLETWRCTLQRLVVYRHQGLVDDERLSKQICVELLDAVDDS